MCGQNLEINIDKVDFYNQEVEKFTNFVESGQLDNLVIRYPLRYSPVYDEIARALRFQNRRDYEKRVITLVRGDRDLAGKMKYRISGLSIALEESSRER